MCNLYGMDDMFYYNLTIKTLSFRLIIISPLNPAELTPYNV